MGPARPTPPEREAAGPPPSSCNRTARGSRRGPGWWCDESAWVLSSFSLGRDLQGLAGVDQVRIFQGVLVGLENSSPVAGVAVEMLRDLGEAVSGRDRVRLLGRLRERGGGRSAALHVGEVRLLVIARHVILLRQGRNCVDKELHETSPSYSGRLRISLQARQNKSPGTLWAIDAP